MHLSVPANYDASILPDLASQSVTEIYGKLPSDIVGGGRPSYMATPLGKKALGSYIRDVHSHGMTFNYLLNSACLGNQEWSGSFQRGLNKLLDWISNQGVTMVTVSLPWLHRVVKTRFPHLKTKIGIYAQVDTVKRAQYWYNEGASAINLESFSINRDFNTLKAIREAVPCDLVLIANHFCQPNCPYQSYHQVGHAHASAHKKTFLIDWPLVQCQEARLRNPTLFISAGWIRPEDLSVYESLGYSSFKLLERNIPSEVLLQRVQAYHGRRFTGNLAELLLSWGYKAAPPGFSWFHFFKEFKAWKAPVKRASTILGFLKDQGMFFTKADAPIRIDTTKIPKDFLDHFLTSGTCLQRDCDSCGYCAGIAKHAVTIEEAFLSKVLPQYQEINQGLNTGSMWE